jgi:hypothetical protein
MIDITVNPTTNDRKLMNEELDFLGVDECDFFLDDMALTLEFRSYRPQTSPWTITRNKLIARGLRKGIKETY